jgi:hypothetical protein
LGFEGEDLSYGAADIKDFRRRFLRAYNTDTSRAIREEEISFGKPREVSPGVIDMKPVRMYSAGLGESDIKRRLDNLGELLRNAIKDNATQIIWG